MRGQVSTEYLIMMGVALLLTVPTVIIFFSQSSQNIEVVNAIQAKQLARKLVDNSEEVYYLGKPSATTIKVVMPSGIKSITISTKTIVIAIDEGGGAKSDLVEVSNVNLSGNLSIRSGTQLIKMENLGDRVNISYSK